MTDDPKKYLRKFDLDDPTDEDEVIATMVAFSGHDHMIALVDMNTSFLKAHAVGHLMGIFDVNKELHDRAMRQCDLSEKWVERAVTAIWS